MPIKLKEAACNYFIALPSDEDDVTEGSLMASFEAGAKWLLAEANKSPLEFSTIYSGSMELPDGKHAAFISGQTSPRKVVFVEDLKKLCEGE